ncbi:MAG: hypothetical protein KAX64_01885 [Chromatiaceae bacterium]|nr:hypothetical protein [Chromatiaceae bacterium]
MCQEPRPANPLLSARYARLDQPSPEGLTAALAELCLTSPRPILILVGGAANLDATTGGALLPVFERLAPRLDELDALVIDGGTPFGVMALMGRARRRSAAGFPLLGVAPLGRIALDPADGVSGPPTVEADAKVPLDANHTHFLLIPGERWGDESPWITDVAEHLATGHGSLMLVAAGGAITLLDVIHRLRARGRVLVLAGSGGTADRLATWRRTGRPLPELDLEQVDAALVEVLDLAEAGSRLPLILAQALAP